MVSLSRGQLKDKSSVLAVLIVTFFMMAGAMPVMQGSEPAAPGVLATKTLDRLNEPVVVEGSQIPDFQGYSNSNIFVWAYQGEWQQVVFQIDEVNGFWPYGGTVHKKYEADGGLMDPDDEICFMSQDTGDQIDSSQWAPGADTDKPRYEITARDPSTGNLGWVYLFYHSTPPSWTTDSYVSWGDGTNSLTASNYTMDYPDDDAHNTYFHDLRVTANGGGDSGQFIDREKFYSYWVALGFIHNDICEQTWETLYATDDDGYSSENGLATGPVRAIRHWRICYAPGESTEWGQKVSFQVMYYNSMVSKQEHGRFWGSTEHQDDRYSIDHIQTTPAASYWDSNGNTATIDGTTTGDSFGSTTPLDWYQVSSPHGSYVLTADRAFSSGSPSVTSNWIDNSGASDTDGGRTGASAGKYGDVAMHRMDIAAETTVWDFDYNMYLLPASIGNQGSDYDGKAANPISTSDIPPASQMISAEVMPPATSNVLIDGLASYSVAHSAAGTVTLTAAVDDTGRGDSTIAFANYTVGYSALPGNSTSASDGAFDQVSENVTATIDISSWAAGVYEIYVYGTDANGNTNTTSAEHATITITDDQPPITVAGSVQVGGQAAYSTLLSAAGPTAITATVDDTGLGGSNIASAQWTAGFANFPGTAMAASDGAFDGVAEAVTDSPDLSAWDAGSHEIYVYGTDSAGQQNTVSGEHATVQITDDVPPVVENMLVEGSDTFTVPLSEAMTAAITGTVSDDGTGGSNIFGANATVGPENWATSQPMNSDTAPDSDIESFTLELDISTWLPGTYQVWMYGQDDVPNYDTAGAFVTIIIINDASPEIKNVLVDGVTDLNLPFSARGLLTLSGDVDDYGHGNLDIAGANYTLGMANWPGTDMNPVDELDSPYESFTVPIDVSTWPVGTYVFYMYGWDVANDYNASSTAHATLTIYDDIAPLVESVLVDGLLTYETTLSAAGTVTLSAIVNDTDRGGSVIGGANYTMGENNWPGSAMSPADTLDSELEAFQQAVDISTWQPGVYDIYVYGWDSEPNYNDFSDQYATIIIHDDLAPEVMNVLVNGSTSFSVGNAQAMDILLTATVSDTGHGDSSIGGANYTLGFTDWPTSVPMIASDGAFDEVTEDVEAYVDISTWPPGTYEFYVYCWDSLGNNNHTSTAHGILTITDNLPPEILNLLVGGAESISTDLDGAGIFTGTVDDTNTGGANAIWALLTDGQQEWNKSFSMNNITPIDSPSEDFTGNIDFSDWAAGTHEVFMYGGDSLGNNNITSQENVTVEIADNKAPETEDWTTLVNDEYQIWLDETSGPMVYLNATVSDAGLGYSNLASVNFTVGAANWPGTSMSPADGSWDNHTEDVEAVIDTTSWSSGTYYIYIYGTDDWGNGQASTSTYARLYIDLLGPEVEGVWADDQNPYGFDTDDSFLLTAYGDDRQNGNSIITAAEYFVDTVGADGSGTPMSPTGFRFDSPYEGAKAGIDCSAWAVGEGHTYYVHFLDDKGHWGEFGSVFVVRSTYYSVPVHPGWNLISLPLMTASTQLDQVLSDVSWDKAYVWDPLDTWDPWHSNTLSRSVNEFEEIDHEMGLWVNITGVGDGYLDISGALPGTTQITLFAGWNLVGYPTLNNRTASDALAGTGADIIGVYNSSSEYLVDDITDLSTVTMSPGNGYWVHVPADTTWVVDW